MPSRIDARAQAAKFKKPSSSTSHDLLILSLLHRYPTVPAEELRAFTRRQVAASNNILRNNLINFCRTYGQPSPSPSPPPSPRQSPDLAIPGAFPCTSCQSFMTESISATASRMGSFKTGGQIYWCTNCSATFTPRY